MTDTRTVSHYHFNEDANAMEIAYQEVKRSFKGTFWSIFVAVLVYLLLSTAIGCAIPSIILALVTKNETYLLGCCSLLLLLFDYPLAELYYTLVNKRARQLGLWDDLIEQQELEKQQEEERMGMWRENHPLEETVRLAMATNNPNKIADLLRKIVQLL